ncbi:MAG: serine--tRNA ligase [Candidatus Wildermuthbacteria bacterium RIFCSPHIGHO2_12_FULL_40_12]|uniref:Serine--tRNA ligase n=1 Tax=Candidatus Wildermuthbacteria bacterium RIFCSPHIGHO2_12_FULL_40_12 TaxID=1802457 RepID=A0A1G2RE92_9BACT|nr:MAG: serine--tRNA ligase [Candidatus Wildermuthbacteria bacterium RIFCSPHIGHO2_12_FULL_40_12]
MLDIKFIRENKDLIKNSCTNRQIDVDIDEILDTDKRYRDNLKAIEGMSAQKNQASKQIVQLKDENEKKKIILEMQELDRNSDRLNVTLKELSEKLNRLISRVPNIPLADVPIGKNDQDNIVLREVGKKPSFNFTIKNHLEIGEGLDLIDVERAAKISGSRSNYLKNEAVMMEFALAGLAFDILTKKGFIPVIPPVMIKEEMAAGTGFLESTDSKEAYIIPEDNLYLIGTSEQSLVAMHAREVFEYKDLPKRYVAFSPCFRREAGSYGRDTKGILRVHQFDKMEMVIFSRQEESQREHQFILSIEERLMQLLKLPYRVVRICTGDMGRPAASQYDIETWLPSENRYRETHSTSNCTDFQSRRLNIRYRDSAGQMQFAHTLNGTAFAIGRTIVAILENYQQKDGSVKIPTVLQKYLKLKVIKRH